jgi:hypothetical protein
MTVLVPDNVVEYIQNKNGRGNIFTVLHTKDHCGRLLSPLDEAIANIKDDSGQYEILVLGSLSTIDDCYGLAEWTPNMNFRQLGFDTEWVEANKLIRFPSGMLNLAYDLITFCGAVNNQCLRGKTVYKNTMRLTV